MRRWLLVLLGLTVFLVALAAFLPASLALAQVEKRVPGLRFEEVSGTLWRGSAGRIELRSQTLGRLQWQLSPLSLLGGAVAIRAHWQDGEREARGRIWFRDRRLHLHEVDARMPAAVLQSALGVPELRPLGRVVLRLERMEIEQGRATAVEGEGWWRDAAVTGAAAATLGELHARLHPTPDGGVGGILQDLGGPLSLAGEFALTQTGYRSELRLAGRTPEIEQALAWVGEPGPGGQRRLRREGRWWGGP